MVFVFEGTSSIISNSVFCENLQTHITVQWPGNSSNSHADSCDDCGNICLEYVNNDRSVNVIDFLMIIAALSHCQ
jgi:hypothetical protein